MTDWVCHDCLSHLILLLLPVEINYNPPCHLLLSQLLNSFRQPIDRINLGNLLQHVSPVFPFISEQA